jgi:6-phosphogluconolactonase
MAPPRPLLPDDLRVYPDADAMSEAAAAFVARSIERAVRRRGRCTLALAGGSTPRGCYERLAEATAVPWSRVHFVWGDERFVPPGHEASNFRMAQEALLASLELPPGHVHPMPTNLPSPDLAAQAYASTLHDMLGGIGAIDLVLLGLGQDGHTASLFPEHIEDDLAETTWTKAVTAPERYAVRDRVTLTYAAINRARAAAFLVSGARKREAVARVLAENDPALPATHVLPRERLLWFMDEAARS